MKKVKGYLIVIVFLFFGVVVDAKYSYARIESEKVHATFTSPSGIKYVSQIDIINEEELKELNANLEKNIRFGLSAYKVKEIILPNNKDYANNALDNHSYTDLDANGFPMDYSRSIVAHYASFESFINNMEKLAIQLADDIEDLGTFASNFDTRPGPVHVYFGNKKRIQLQKPKTALY